MNSCIVERLTASLQTCILPDGYLMMKIQKNAAGVEQLSPGLQRTPGKTKNPLMNPEGVQP